MKNQVILALDYGEKKIGLALKLSQSLIVKPFGNFKNQGDILFKVTSLCKQKDVTMIILGYPLSLSLKKTRITFLVEHFARRLYNSIPRKIHIRLVNERLTTASARSEFFLKNQYGSDAAWKRSKDSIAASHILNRYLELVKEGRMNGY